MNLKAFLLLWFHISLLGLIALAFERLVISGHNSSLFGKYFEAKVVEKTRRILALGGWILKGPPPSHVDSWLIVIKGGGRARVPARASTVGLLIVGSGCLMFFKCACSRTGIETGQRS